MLRLPGLEVTTATVPSTASPSSSDVSSTAIEPRCGAERAARRSAAVIMAATDVFMSAAPRPWRWPSRSVGVNGSLVQRSSGPGGTTSTWPAKQTSGAPRPRRAHRLETPPRSMRSQWNPSGASLCSTSARVPAVTWLITAPWDRMV